MRYIILLISILFVLGCGGEKQVQPQQPVEVQAPPVAGFKPIPNDLLMNVWNNGEMIDYIFHEPSFSMNQNELNSIRANLTYVSGQGLSSIPAGCKPRARQFFQVGGDIVLEADIYLDQKCQFYVFFIDGKAAYGNHMTPEGAEFFGNMVKQAMLTRQGIQQGG